VMATSSAGAGARYGTGAGHGEKRHCLTSWQRKAFADFQIPQSFTQGFTSVRVRPAQ
jgi:hypothetical protein